MSSEDMEPIRLGSIIVPLNIMLAITISGIGNASSFFSSQRMLSRFKPEHPP
ncbi:MAG: hypothetical protein FGF52_00415 [Candidatus Brockarchaeota archaeon]|nr:hypothetical protein [Candidatus Brockarchaeota archaeon]